MRHTTRFFTKRTRRRHRIARLLKATDPAEVVTGIWEATTRLPDIAYGLEVCDRAYASERAMIRYNAVLGLQNLAQREDSLPPEIPTRILTWAFGDAEEHVRCAAQDVAEFINQKYGWRVGSG
jgi:hypothetical protein